MSPLGVPDPPDGARPGVPASWPRLGAATRPYPGETANGDGWAAVRTAGACRIAVVDGLGHGPQAAVATSAALDALEAAPDLGPERALRSLHGALAGTRGAAVSVALIEPALGRLTFAGVGNVEAHLWPAGPAGRAVRPTPYRGIVGAILPTVRSAEFAIQPGWLLILHTDGLSARLRVDPAAWVTGAGIDPQALARDLLERWGRATDDATVVVATG